MNTPLRLSPIQLDRAVGAVLASAVGDALGSQYEFQGSLPDSAPVTFGIGRFGHAVGEWTDDTSMAMPLLDALAAGRSLDDAAVLGGIVGRWLEWAATSKDVGVQTSQVFAAIADRAHATEEAALAAARVVHGRSGRSGGNGSLMRTGPVALGSLGASADALAATARRVSALTHFEDDAGDACVLWSLAIRHAVLTGAVDVEAQVAFLPADRRSRWSGLIAEATSGVHPRDLTANNGWVVGAFQAALAAIAGGGTLVEILERAVRCGHDTDTVAAIAGSLAGAVHGGSAVPLAWKQLVHGWPVAADGRARTADDLVRLAVLAVRGGVVDGEGWPSAARLEVPWSPDTLVLHPSDPEVLLGSLRALDRVPADVTAVVSLCRIGAAQVPSTVTAHVPVWLVDRPASNANLEFVLTEAADAVARLRASGHRVLLHCAEARSRTSAVAALYAVRHREVAVADAWAAGAEALPDFAPEGFLVEAVGRVAGGTDVG